MILKIPTQEIGTAVIEYLDRRGVQVSRDKVCVTYDREENEFYVIVRDVEIPPKEGPYR